jgi:hypothetical protein
LHSSQPDHGAGDRDECFEGWQGLFASQGDAPAVADFVEETLNEVALFVTLSASIYLDQTVH